MAMDFETLFSIYQTKLQSLNRRCPDNKEAKYALFSMFEDCRTYVDDPSIRWENAYSNVENLPAYVFDNGYECKAYGILTYREHQFPVYTDDYGCQDFVIYADHQISVDGMGGTYDWFYELDYIIDNIGGTDQCTKS